MSGQKKSEDRPPKPELWPWTQSNMKVKEMSKGQPVLRVKHECADLEAFSSHSALLIIHRRTFVHIDPVTPAERLPF